MGRVDASFSCVFFVVQHARKKREKVSKAYKEYNV